jgi:C2H2-type zinc-finger domain/Zinc finger, C2H2 type
MASMTAEMRNLHAMQTYADTQMVCADGSLRLNRLLAAFVLKVAMGGDISAMHDIAAVAENILEEDLIILLPAMTVVEVNRIIEKCLSAAEPHYFARDHVSKKSSSTQTTPSTAGTLKKNHVCPFCQFRARSKSNLNQHLQSRHGKIRYRCSSCSYFTTTSNNLQRHVRTVHDGVKLSCDSCAYSASSRAKLKHHRLTQHEGLRYPCAQCTFSATAATSLKRHMRTLHGDGGGAVRLPCAFCDKKLASSQHLKVHVDSVHKGLRHPCAVCAYVATTKGHLRAHVKRAHSNKE